VFSTLLGPLPTDPERPPGSAAGEDAAACLDNVAALGAIGLELVSDGGQPAEGFVDPGEIVARWQAAADTSTVPVKQVVLGPYSVAARSDQHPSAAAEPIRAAILALAGAGCPLVEIAEPDAAAIASDDAARGSFTAAHQRLLDGSEGIHASLALPSANLDTAGTSTFFDLAYASYAFDLIAGPDNWRLITHAPADRGIVCGALNPAPDGDHAPELLVWAAHYAAAANGRGLARVGLANAPGLATLDRASALRILRIVAEATRIASVESAEEMAGLLDPRAIDSRSAALGRFEPARRRRR